MSRACESAAFADLLACWPTGVAVVETALGEVRRGATISSLTAFSNEPPSVLFCLRRESAVVEVASRVHRVRIHILGETQGAVAARFGGRCPEGEDPFAGPHGAVALGFADATIDGRVVTQIADGTHVAVVCAVEGCAVRNTLRDLVGPLVYYDRRFRGVTVPHVRALEV